MSEAEGFDFEDFMADETLEVEGVWRPFGKGARIKLARWENPNHERLLRKKAMAEKEVLQAEDDLSSETGKRITIEVMAHTIIKDWEGIKQNGVAVPFSISKALEFLQNKTFREKIKGMCDNIDHYQIKTEADGVKV